MRVVLYALAGFLFLAVTFHWLAANSEQYVNRVDPLPLQAVGEHAQALHRASFVVDLHADSALMGRDLLERSSVGHVDLPRLVEGGVGLQFFTIPTRVPLSLPFDIHRTARDDPDMLRVLDWVQSGSLRGLGAFRRGMIQAERVHRAARRSDGALVVIRTRRDLAALLDARAKGENKVGALLGLEGAHALEDRLENLTRFESAGVRMIGLAHFFDNGFAGSAHGIEKGGLTELGRELVTRMVDRGIMIDLAHASPKTIDEVIALVDVPTVVSHTGVKGTCDNPRNLSDRHVRAIAKGGGVIGVGYWEMAVCGTAPREIVAAMLHIYALVGDEYIALGSDYDGGTTVNFDTSQLPVLTQAMLDADLSDESIAKILGGNIVRVMRQVLPEG
ncbi:MAG: dipeptidase [Deltaproteobacteria bacterium]|nr:dipeptidase [Deltaproteobacteria bacterium]